jgi:hypothetical protein
VTGFERGHGLAVGIALDVLPIAFEILALQLFLEGPQFFGHRLFPS